MHFIKSYQVLSNDYDFEMVVVKQRKGSKQVNQLRNIFEKVEQMEQISKFVTVLQYDDLSFLKMTDSSNLILETDLAFSDREITVHSGNFLIDANKKAGNWLIVLDSSRIKTINVRLIDASSSRMAAAAAVVNATAKWFHGLTTIIGLVHTDP